MSSKTTFVIPNFDKSMKDKVNDVIEVISPSTLRMSKDDIFYRPAISNGFPCNTDGVFACAMKINEAKNGSLIVGFTDMKTFDSKCCGYAGYGDFPGTSLCCYDACISGNCYYGFRSTMKDEQHRDDLLTKDNQLERIVQSHRSDLDLSHQQLELERAEHQKTRNLLHQIKMELKDMEIYYLMKEKESGQRRQREEANDHFKVKEEPN